MNKRKLVAPRRFGFKVGATDMPKSVKLYLRRFGYLGRECHCNGTHLCGHAVRAIKSFQKNSGLKVTGTVDRSTVTQMSKPRCGLPDIGAYVLEGRKWDHMRLTYSFLNGTDDIAGKREKKAIREAMRVWSDVTPLRFRQIFRNLDQADIRVLWGMAEHGDNFAFDGPSGELAHAFFPPPNGGALAGDMHFDDAELWNVSGSPGPGAVDLVTVAAHELGHSLGLGHSQVRNALMYPYYGGPHRRLAQDDIDAITRLYPIN